MIRHVVMFKFHDEAGFGDAPAIAAERATSALPASIAEIEEWFCGRNVSGRDIAQDYLVMGDFANQEALERYLEHPAHQDAIAAWAKVATWAVVDVRF